MMWIRSIEIVAWPLATIVVVFLIVRTIAKSRDRHLEGKERERALAKIEAEIAEYHQRKAKAERATANPQQPSSSPPSAQPPPPAGDIINAYDLLLKLTIHGQENKWNTLSVFLIFQSILLLGWATFFAAKIATPVRFALSGIAILSGFAWRFIGTDYAKASWLYSQMAEALESFFPDWMPTPLKELAEQIKEKDEKWKRWWFPTVPGARFLTTAVPVGFVILHAFLVFALWTK